MKQAELDLEVVIALMESDQPLTDGAKEWIVTAASRLKEVLEKCKRETQ
ncbi:hypothetical protein [Vibrio owensii]|uniref:Uncharacterized protein n=1 Tax=Vibrio owensii TaxID=696485 RepID=A0AAP9KC17_9VIBR|nr:hypothetical protein [Vibrio owensii]QGH49254.1 hypothetical protein APZ19_19235 [Vibrio owensii]